MLGLGCCSHSSGVGVGALPHLLGLPHLSTTHQLMMSAEVLQTLSKPINFDL